jgi:response regulator of citrate/malate metabolism
VNPLLRVLVVDDAPAVTALHARFVDAHPGCLLVGVATTGPEAVTAIRAVRPDLVLLDVHLPGYSGIEVLRQIRADAAMPQPEVVAVTAARDIESVRDARILGARHYLVKPFSADELHARIDDVISERASARAGSSLDQHAVDAAMRPSPRPPLPKGYSAETLSTVRAALARHESASAADIADDVGLSRVSCRRYLEHIADIGLASRALDYSTAGRPRTLYQSIDETAQPS